MTSKSDKIFEAVMALLALYAVVDIMWRLYDGHGILG